jgi:hypothetical protein
MPIHCGNLAPVADNRQKQPIGAPLAVFRAAHERVKLARKCDAIQQF